MSKEKIEEALNDTAIGEAIKKTSTMSREERRKAMKKKTNEC